MMTPTRLIAKRRRRVLRSSFARPLGDVLDLGGQARGRDAFLSADELTHRCAGLSDAIEAATATQHESNDTVIDLRDDRVLVGS